MHSHAARGQSWECWLPPLPLGYKFRCSECNCQDLPGLTSDKALTCTNTSGAEAVQGQAGGWLQWPAEQQRKPYSQVMALSGHLSAASALATILTSGTRVLAGGQM